MKTQQGLIWTLFGLFALLVAGLTLYARATQHSDWISQTYPIKDVTQVAASGGCIMTITQGPTDELRVDAKPDTMARISVDQTGPKLSLRLSSYVRQVKLSNLLQLHNDQYRYHLQLRNLERLELDDACIVQVGDWQGRALEVRAGHASKLDFGRLTLDEFAIEQHNASLSHYQTLQARQAEFLLSDASKADIDAAGRVDFAKVTLASASYFDGRELTAQRAELDASHASHLRISVTQQLNARASHASSVDYWGAPKANTSANHASSINARNSGD